MNKNIEKLLELIEENPDLPIIPFVHSEVVADDMYTWWMADFGVVEITEYVIGSDGQVYEKEEEPQDDVLFDFCPDWEDWPDEKIEETYKNLPWEKCIVVHICF
ncbi:MAG: hypothetical protein IKH14_07035 [Prevotella sp.]|nr:hypothetical protein [Prevotella sp.]